MIFRADGWEAPEVRAEDNELGNFALVGSTLLSGWQCLGQEFGKGCTFLGLVHFATSHQEDPS